MKRMKKTTGIKTYSELISLTTFEDRYNYLRLDGNVGEETFGFDRYLNQKFYTSQEWKSIRDKIIIRDGGYDLGMEGYEIYGRILIHHMNPITKEDIQNRTDMLLNPEYLISTCKRTHDAIHYGGIDLISNQLPIERFKNDTCPWRHDQRRI